MARARNITRIKASTPISLASAYRFLRRFAKHIPQEALEPVPRRGGPSVVFYYEDDKVLKVPKLGARKDLLKEATVLPALRNGTCPVDLAEPLEIHREGYYAIFTRLQGHNLESQPISSLSAEETCAFSKSVGSFLSYLHSHDFPQKVLNHVPKAGADIHVLARRTERKLAYLEQQLGKTAVVDSYDELATYRNLEPETAVLHNDFTLNHIFAGAKPDRFGVIDFADAQIGDPAYDFASFYEELVEEDVDAPAILDNILGHYGHDDRNLRGKIDFVNFTDRIRRQSRDLRRQLKRDAKKRAGGQS